MGIRDDRTGESTRETRKQIVCSREMIAPTSKTGVSREHLLTTMQVHYGVDLHDELTTPNYHKI